MYALSTDYDKDYCNVYIEMLMTEKYKFSHTGCNRATGEMNRYGCILKTTTDSRVQQYSLKHYESVNLSINSPSLMEHKVHYRVRKIHICSGF